MNVHPLVEEYVDDICRQVRAKELRKDIREELTGHLEELMESKRAQGLDDSEVAQWAITQMGDAHSVAKGLNQVHKPRIPWSILGSLALLLMIALVAMYTVDLSYKAAQVKYGEMDLFVRQAINMGVGLVVLFGLSRIHYRKLLNFSWVLYCGTIVLMLAAFTWGPQINGMSGYLLMGPITFDVIGISPYLLIVSAAGFLYQRRENWKAVFWHTALFTLAPLILYATAPSFSNFVIYALGYMLFLYISKCGWKWVVPHAFIFSTLLLIFTLHTQHGRYRIAAFFHRYEFPMDAGYMYIQIDEAVRSAGWWGHGFASVTQKLPYIHTETVFTYMVYSLGWLFGAFVLLSTLIFVSQLVKAASSVRDTYGKMLVNGLGALFAVQFVWSIGMSLGVLPILAVTLPFISYGGSGMLIQLSAIGIIYSVYRRKDMIRLK